MSAAGNTGEELRNKELSLGSRILKVFVSALFEIQGFLSRLPRTACPLLISSMAIISVPALHRLTKVRCFLLQSGVRGLKSAVNTEMFFNTLFSSSFQVGI